MGAYDEEIKALLAGYRVQLLCHAFRLETMMGTEGIPIYTRWQELKAVIRRFDEMADQFDKMYLLVERIHQKD